MKDYKKECEHWKKKAAYLQGKLKQMEDDVKGWEETQKSLFAVVTGVIAGVGADEDHPVKVSREAINDALEGKTQVIVGYDAGPGEYTLFAKTKGE